MFEPLIKLAISKSASDAEAEALAPVLAAAIELDEAERRFAERIDANKALRGESPTKLSRAKRVELDQYAADAARMEAEQLNAFDQFTSAAGIVAALSMALEPDIRFWSKAHTKAHPDDAELVQEFALSKRRLHAAMSAFVEAFGEVEP